MHNITILTQMKYVILAKSFISNERYIKDIILLSCFLLRHLCPPLVISPLVISSIIFSQVHAEKTKEIF